MQWPLLFWMLFYLSENLIDLNASFLICIALKFDAKQGVQISCHNCDGIFTCPRVLHEKILAHHPSKRLWLFGEIDINFKLFT